MKTSMLLIILAVSLTLITCSQKETVIEETQEQIQKRLDKEKAEQLIFGTWKLHLIQENRRWVADSIKVDRTMTFTKEGIVIINHRDSVNTYRQEIKYRYNYADSIGLKRYYFTADDVYNQLTLTDVTPHSLTVSNSKINYFFQYLKIKQDDK